MNFGAEYDHVVFNVSNQINEIPTSPLDNYYSIRVINVRNKFTLDIIIVSKSIG